MRLEITFFNQKDNAITYGIPFLFLEVSMPALAVIVATHFVIDRWRLARYVVYAKNWLSPSGAGTWEECSGTGYPNSKPAFLAVWLLIIADNVMHVLINGVAIKYL